MDIDLINEIGKEFRRRFPSEKITKILTIEASGIGIACIAAQYFHVPVVFAKKAQSINIDGEVYHSKVESFTHKRTYDVILSKKFLGPGRSRSHYSMISLPMAVPYGTDLHRQRCGRYDRGRRDCH